MPQGPHDPAAAQDQRIMRLEEKMAFQDDLIEKLNVALIELSDLAFAQEKRLDEFEGRLEQARDDD